MNNTKENKYSIDKFSEIKTIHDFNSEVKKDPKILYHINVGSLIKTNKLNYIDGMKILAIKVKDNKFLYSYASHEYENFVNTLSHISIIVGWGINLFIIIVSSYENDVPKSLITLLGGIGNLLSIMMATIVNFYSLQEEIIEFKKFAHKLDRLQSKIEFTTSLVEYNNDSNNDDLKNKLINFMNEYENLKETIPFVISIRTQEKYYKNFGKKTLEEAYNKIFETVLRLLIEEKKQDNLYLQKQPQDEVIKIE